MPLLAAFHRLAVVPAVIIDDAAQAVPLAEAMKRGGLACAEVTLRTPVALEALRRMAAVPDMLVGAGTVTTVEQAQQAIEAGAQFIVSPGIDAQLVRFCQGVGVLIIPGAVTPTEIMLAQNLGLRVVKFFPSGMFGGLPAIQSLLGPFPNMKFLPTGGITLENLGSYLGNAGVIACGGTWMVKREWLQKGQLGNVEEACRMTVANVRRRSGL